MRPFVTCVVALLGCGGKVDFDADAGSDASTDADVAVLDAADTAVLDAGRPPCPALLPARGDVCAAVGQECAYATSCGGLVRAFCGGSGAAFVWEHEVVKECPPKCPPTPRAFTPCEAPLTCDYDGPCGKITATCKGPGSSWFTTIGSCPGTLSCPPAEPAVGEPCFGGGKCGYDTPCGPETVYCNDTGYSLGIDYALCAGCPKSQPSDGSPCTGTSPCWYQSKCGKRNESRCVGGAWRTTIPDCST